jgi:hypothetical protein
MPFCYFKEDSHGSKTNLREVGKKNKGGGREKFIFEFLKACETAKKED